MFTSRSGRRRMAYVFLAAFGMRIGMALVLFHYASLALWYQANEPSMIAAHLAAGEGFSSPYAGVDLQPTAQQPPLYPALVALIFLAFGTRTAAALAVLVSINAAADAVTAVGMAALGKRYFPPRVGTLAALVWIVWPQAAITGVGLTSYALSAMVIVLAALGIPTILAAREWRRLTGLGIAAGLATLLNPALAILPVLAGAAWIYRSGWRGMRAAAWMGLAAGLVLLPWTIRNYAALDRLIPIRDNAGLELWVGNRLGMQGLADFSGDFPSSNPARYQELGEIQFMDSVHVEAMAYIRQEPGLFLRRIVGRMAEFWSFRPLPWGWGILGVLAWAGAILAAWRRNPPGIFIVAMMAVMPIPYYLTHVWAPYRHPLEPLIVLAAVYAVLELKHSIVDSNTTPAARTPPAIAPGRS